MAARQFLWFVLLCSGWVLYAVVWIDSPSFREIRDSPRRDFCCAWNRFECVDSGLRFFCRHLILTNFASFVEGWRNLFSDGSYFAKQRGAEICEHLKALMWMAMTGAEVHGDCLCWCMCAKHGKLKTRLIRTVNSRHRHQQNFKSLWLFRKDFRCTPIQRNPQLLLGLEPRTRSMLWFSGRSATSQQDCVPFSPW